MIFHFPICASLLAHLFIADCLHHKYCDAFSNTCVINPQCDVRVSVTRTDCSTSNYAILPWHYSKVEQDFVRRMKPAWHLGLAPCPGNFMCYSTWMNFLGAPCDGILTSL